MKHFIPNWKGPNGFHRAPRGEYWEEGERGVAKILNMMARIDILEADGNIEEHEAVRLFLMVRKTVPCDQITLN